jgi:hypothetical protein
MRKVGPAATGQQDFWNRQRRRDSRRDILFSLPGAATRREDAQAKRAIRCRHSIECVDKTTRCGLAAGNGCALQQRRKQRLNLLEPNLNER